MMHNDLSFTFLANFSAKESESWDTIRMLEQQSIYLFTGENTFTLSQEILHWKSSFSEKHGIENCTTLIAKSIQFSNLLNDVSSAPFIAEKRLTLVEGIPKIEKEQMELLFQSIHADCILVFYDSKPDKRTSVYKLLKKHAQEKVFNPLSKQQLIVWLRTIATKHQTTFSDEFCSCLIDMVGEDQWSLKMEALKALSHADPDPPSLATLEHVCIPSRAQTVWALSDCLGRGDISGALLLCDLLSRQGEDAHSLWNIFLWIIRNAATLWIWQQEKNLPLAALTKETGVRFSSARSLLPFVKSLSEEDLQRILRKVTEEEISLKTGGIRSTAEDNTELMTVLERCLLECRIS